MKITPKGSNPHTRATQSPFFGEQDARLLNGKLHNNLIWSTRTRLPHRLHIMAGSPERMYNSEITAFVSQEPHPLPVTLA